MKLTRFAYVFLSTAAFLTLAFSLQAGVPTCTVTDFIRDGNNLTAFLINPTHNVSGNVNATGCDIGVYYGPGATGKVALATVYGANYYGVVNNGANVEVEFSAISNIGADPTNGDQGYAVYFAMGSYAQGSVHDNLIWDYGTGGIIIDGPLAKNTLIANNIVTGQGPSSTLTQTGIQLGFGATGTVSGNFVNGNSYTGPNGGYGNGILIFGGACYATQSPVVSNSVVQQNTLIGNDVAIEVDNLDQSCNPITTATRNLIANNTIQDKSVNNTTGWAVSPAVGFQAGVEDAGTGDMIQYNNICGAGYNPGTPPSDLYFIDLTYATGTSVTGNTTSATCGGHGSQWSSNTRPWNVTPHCHRSGLW